MTPVRRLLDPSGPLRRLAAASAVVVSLVACGRVTADMPACEGAPRLALVAQAVPDASLVPCMRALPTGWTVHTVRVTDGAATFSLSSDRAQGRAVKLRFSSGCDISGATPTRAAAEGVRSYIRLQTVAPRYAGTRLDSFPGGCLSSEFDFPRGPHIPLMDELGAAVGLYRRQQLRLDLAAAGYDPDRGP